MALSTSRPLEKSQSYRRFPWISYLVAWLNGEPTPSWEKTSKASRRRVLDFIDNFRDVLEAIESAPSSDLINSPTPRLSRLMTELNARLDEYPTSVLFCIDYGREWIFDDGAVRGKRPAIESVAVHSAIELARRGLLQRIMSCECGRWFFGKFTHQRFCSTRCRKRHHEHSEAFRAARRAYMRRYYRLKVSGKVK
jgi:hypothetical protein